MVKRLDERESIEMKYCKVNSKFSEKRPHNAYIWNKKQCCEIIDVGDKQDANKEILCRVYERTDSLFTYPCDSRIVGAYVVDIRGAHIKNILASNLTRKAITMTNNETMKYTFLAILHEFNL